MLGANARMKDMYELKLCRTREYSPQIVEHWLSSQQNRKGHIHWEWQHCGGKVRAFSNMNLANLFSGSTSHKNHPPPWKARFYARQNNLLPIKRPSQFEDKLERTRIWPTNSLIQSMHQIPGAGLCFKIRPIPERLRHAAMKKARMAHYKADHAYDQWESLGWFTWSWRRFLGPPLRRAIRRIGKRTQNSQEHTSSTHEREEAKQALLDKLARPLFEVEISMTHSFESFLQGFSLPYLGQLETSSKKNPLILSAEELASLLTPPHPGQCAMQLNTESSAHFPAPENPLAFSEEDRKRHLYLLGKTGMGKSSTLLHFIGEDILQKRSLTILDPHGDLIDATLRLIPPNQHKRIVLLDPSLTETPISMNPLEETEQPALQAAMLLEIFFALSHGSWGPRLEYILRNALLTLIHCPNTTLLDLPRLLTQDPTPYLQEIQDPELLRYWREEFLSQSKITRLEQVQPILNKVGPLITHPILRNIFSQPKSKFNFETALAKKQIVLIPLSKGKLGEDASRCLGMVFLAMLKSALLKRSHLPENERPLCSTFIDEFQNLCTPTLLSLLSEARKYGLALTLAHQYLTQLPPEIQDAVLGNVGSLFIFRCSHQDALKLAPDLQVTEADLTGLPPFHAYVKALYNQELHPLFRFQSPKPHTHLRPTAPPKLASFGRPRISVEAKLHKRYTKRKSTRP